MNWISGFRENMFARKVTLNQPASANEIKALKHAVGEANCRPLIEMYSVFNGFVDDFDKGSDIKIWSIEDLIDFNSKNASSNGVGFSDFQLFVDVYRVRPDGSIWSDLEGRLLRNNIDSFLRGISNGEFDLSCGVD
jgi:hypothetical protein